MIHDVLESSISAREYVFEKLTQEFDRLCRVPRLGINKGCGENREKMMKEMKRREEETDGTDNKNRLDGCVTKMGRREELKGHSLLTRWNFLFHRMRDLFRTTTALTRENKRTNHYCLAHFKRLA